MIALKNRLTAITLFSLVLSVAIVDLRADDDDNGEGSSTGVTRSMRDEQEQRKVLQKILREESELSQSERSHPVEVWGGSGGRRPPSPLGKDEEFPRLPADLFAKERCFGEENFEEAKKYGSLLLKSLKPSDSEPKLSFLQEYLESLKPSDFEIKIHAPQAQSTAFQESYWQNLEAITMPSPEVSLTVLHFLPDFIPEDFFLNDDVAPAG